MSDDTDHAEDSLQTAMSDLRTAAEGIDQDDPHKVEKLANIGKEEDAAEVAEKE